MVSTFWQCLLILILTTCSVEGASYAKQCPLSDSDIVEISYNPATGEYTVTDTTSGGERARQDEGHRGLRRRDSDNIDETLDFASEAINVLSLNHRSTVDRSATSTIVLQARSCPCAVSGTYCLFKNGRSQNTCGIPRDPNLPVGCYNLSTKMVFIRNAWPVVVLWYGALFIFLIATDNGRSARNWMLSKICPSRNDMLADRILRREIQIRGRLRDARARRSRLTLLESGSIDREDDSNGVRTQTLVLKTKKFNAKREREKRRRQRASSIIEVAKRESDAFENEGEGCTSSGDTDGVPSVVSPPSAPASNDAAYPVTPERAKPSSLQNDTPDTTADSICSSLSYPLTPSPLASPNSTSDEDGILKAMSADAFCSPCAPCSTDQDNDSNCKGNHFEASDDESNEDEFTCTICIMDIEDGDKVGVLPNCQHIFHVSCLKEWIKRRNVCPLCQSPDIATPKRREDREGACVTNSATAQSDDLPASPSGDGSVGLNANETAPSMSEGHNSLSSSSNTVWEQQRMRRANDPVLASLRSRLFASGEQAHTQSPTREGSSMSAVMPSRDDTQRTRVVSPQRSLSSRQQSHNEEENRTLVLSGSAEDADFHRRRRRARARAAARTRGSRSASDL